MMMAVLVMVIYNQVAERIAPWWARPFTQSAAIPLSRPRRRAAFAPDLADGFSVRFRSDHLMGLRPDSIKEINLPHLGQESRAFGPVHLQKKVQIRGITR
jgi:hypothetical protein